MVDLPAAVLTHKSHNSSALHVQVNVVKHPVAPEGLAHAADRQDNIVFRVCHV